jgi:hypothetical protein
MKKWGLLLVVLVTAFGLVMPATASAGSAVVADSYSETHFTTETDYGSGSSFGQSFTAIDGTVDSAKFYLKQNGGLTGDLVAHIYAHSGTFGTSSVPIGAPLATSAPVDAATLGTSYSLVTFVFDNTVSLAGGQAYVLVLDAVNSTGSYTWVRLERSGIPGHPGNLSSNMGGGGWNAYAIFDIPFYVYETPTPVGETTPPEVTDVTAVPDPQTFCGDVTVSADATDSSGVAAVSCSLDGGPWTAMTYTGAGDTWQATMASPWAGAHSVEVTATDLADPANTSPPVAAGFTVAPCRPSVVWTGPAADADDDGTTVLAATVSGASCCADGAPVTFTLTPLLGGTPIVVTATAAADGRATATAPVPLGVYDVGVSVAERDLGGTSDPECLGATNAGAADVLAVLCPNAGSEGGGRYKVASASPRVDFDYEAEVRVDRATGKTIVSGEMLWTNQGTNRLRGRITGYQAPVTAPVIAGRAFAKSAQIMGSGTLYDFQPGTRRHPGTWINPRTVTFKAWVADGGLQTTRIGRRTVTVQKPDAFGMTIEPDALPAESVPVVLSGGGIRIK